MEPEEIWRWLQSGRKKLVLATVDPSGRPHVAPVWFVVLGTHLGFRSASDAGTKIRNLKANRVFAGVVEEGDEYESLRGVLLRGIAGPATPPFADRVQSGLSDRYHGGDTTLSSLPERAYREVRDREFSYMRLIPLQVASWNNADL